VRHTADWIADELRRIGVHNVEVVQTKLHPIVYADHSVGPDARTILVYGHYDVQPVDPISEWQSDPFKPEERDDNLYGRGASDMKGSLVAFLCALEALLKQGPLPLNVKFLLEGEEEIGSPNLEDFVQDNMHRLAADVALNIDGAIHGADAPAITYALRGLAYFEVEVRGAKQDLHSGLYGGAIANPANVLCELIAGMHDAQGRVTLPGFYDKVRALPDEERQSLARLPFSEEEWKNGIGVPEVYGEAGYTTLERIGARPTLDVNGIIGGFTGDGAKTVLPAKALAKISTRLVADQDPAEIHGQLTEYMKARAPKSVTWEVRELSKGAGAIMRRDSIAMKAALDALRQTFGVDPFFKRDGGSVPVVSMMQRELGYDSIMLGFALPNDNIHGPNEKQHLPTLYKGVDTYIRFLANMAKKG
jgi:acetylornithine deacetylase/succinyl-diaminopimelate desuccinylase-like protein